MVIKYNTCSFSENKIAPGHGLKYCEVNGKTHMFITKKVHRLYLHGKKPLTIRWSIKWRTSHKKGKVEEAKKKVIRQKKERQVKAIVGLSVEEKKLRSDNRPKDNYSKNVKGHKGLSKH